MAFDPYELTYRQMKKSQEKSKEEDAKKENTESSSKASQPNQDKQTVQPAKAQRQAQNPDDKKVVKKESDKKVKEKSPENVAKPATRKEPFSGQDGIDDYESVDELSKKIEYGGGESEEKKEKAPTTEELRNLRKKKKAEAASKRVRQKSNTNSKSSDVTHIKEIPTSVFTICGTMFPLLNKRESVIAYILATSNEEIPDDVDDKVYDAVMDWRESHKDDNPLYGINEKLELLNKKANVEEKRNRTLELGIAYIISDRLGYRKGRTESIDNLEITEENIVNFLNKLRKESMRLIANENIKNGRPMK